MLGHLVIGITPVTYVNVVTQNKVQAVNTNINFSNEKPDTEKPLFEPRSIHLQLWESNPFPFLPRREARGDYGETGLP